MQIGGDSLADGDMQPGEEAGAGGAGTAAESMQLKGGLAVGVVVEAEDHAINDQDVAMTEAQEGGGHAGEQVTEAVGMQED
mmetsp:Transcript_8247/g.17669  ORF Transcript_8247/g.17669 Transcript_8247/m.17669 type:complete len:81 (+) Transcript_8247:43-285(+)